MKKAFLWVFSTILFITFISIGWSKYTSEKSASDFEKTHQLIEEFLPTTIDGYPSIKHYYDNNFVNGVRYYPEQQLLGAYDKEIYKIQSLRARIDCQSIIEIHTPDAFEAIKHKYENEIGLEQYTFLSEYQNQILFIPPIVSQYKKYVQDQKVTWKEFCSLINMSTAAADYRKELEKKSETLHLKSNL